MASPLEYTLVHSDGREELVRVEGKTVTVTVRADGEVADEFELVHRFAHQAKEAAKAHVWKARERGFVESVSEALSDAPIESAMLIRYHVTAVPGLGTWQRGGETTYVLDGRRLGTNDAVQEFESEDDARSALRRIIRPSKDYVVTEEWVSREEAGLSRRALTDMLTHDVTHFERNDANGRLTIRFREAHDSSGYAPLVNAMALSEAGTAHLYCDVDGSPGEAWTSAIRATDLPFRSLIFDTTTESLTRQQEHSLGDLSLTLARMPNLERVFVSGGIRTSPLEHASLRELYLLADPLEALARSSLPSLQKLVVCVANDSAADHDVLVRSSLRSLDAPLLSVLCVYGLSEAIKAAVELATGLPSLRALALGGPILEEELEALTEAELGPLSGLAHLELDLDGCEPPACVRERLPRLHELNMTRILPSEYEGW